MRWAPETRTGTWTLGLAAASVAGVILSAVGFATGVLESADGFSDNWLLTGWGVAILGAAAGSVVAGAVAIFRRHDRSWAVLLAACIGLLLTAVMLSEVAQGL